MIAQDVVVLTTHDIGRHLRCYGVESVSSPNLDSVAAGGVRFDLAFASAPQCSPSRASLATGLYPHNNGVMGLAHPGFDWDLFPDVPHAAAVFGRLGFETHLFVGQHVSPHPEQLGFAQIHPTHAIDRALTSEKRLYLEINFEETHRPYPAPRPTAPEPQIPGYLPAGPEAIAEMKAVEGTIAAMDAAVGTVLEALEKAGRANDALVIFTTDHGLAMPRAKCTLYDPGLEVALIMRWPAAAPGGRTQAGLVSNIDVLPTLLEAVGAPVREGIQGRSLLPLVLGEPPEAREAIFAEKTFHSYYDPMRCVRTRRHKFIRNFEVAFAVEVPGDIQQGAIFRAHPSLYSTDRPAVVELYDLDVDPLERHNLAGSSEVSGVEGELSGALWDWMRETDDPLLRGPVPSPRYRLAIKSGDSPDYGAISRTETW